MTNIISIMGLGFMGILGWEIERVSLIGFRVLLRIRRVMGLGIVKLIIQANYSLIKIMQ